MKRYKRKILNNAKLIQRISINFNPSNFHPENYEKYLSFIVTRNWKIIFIESFKTSNDPIPFHIDYSKRI